MAKIIHLTVRHPEALPRYVAAVTHAARRLMPDNLPDHEPVIIHGSGIVAGIAGPPDFVHARGSNIAAGYLVEPDSDWDRTGGRRPDGAYALFRSDPDVVEIVSDSVASRSVWYALTDDIFIASTSQRAIVAILGSFEFDPSVMTWMLTTGTLGPGKAWDRRIRPLDGDATVALNRNTWSLSSRTAPLQFDPLDLPEAAQERRVMDVLGRAVGAARVNDPRWAIALSGGVDSRTLLYLLRDKEKLRAITWGVRQSLDDPASDASIAAQLAAQCGLRHVYFETDLSPAPVEQLFDRFLRVGEGRIDRLSGYADGFALWETIVRSGVRGIIRGDEAFGWRRVASPADVRFRAGMSLWTDFQGLPELNTLDLMPQTMPEWSLQRPDESLETWRDRLYQQHRIPVILAALADLKLAYVEVANPLLCTSIIDAIRQLPDALRTEKLLLRRICQALAPDTPLARSNSIQPPDDLLRSPRVVEFLRDSLSANSLAPEIPRQLADYVTAGLRTRSSHGATSWRRRLRRTLAVHAGVFDPARRFRTERPLVVEPNRLAFRTYLVSGATRMFERDATCLQPPPSIQHG